MHTLRSSPLLARLILAWLLLALGVAMASPVVSPKTMMLVCTSGNMPSMVMLDADGDVVSPSHASLDCPACLALTLPPPEARWPETASAQPEQPQRPAAAAPPPARAGAALPPRGPPQAG